MWMKSLLIKVSNKTLTHMCLWAQFNSLNTENQAHTRDKQKHANKRTVSTAPRAILPRWQLREATALKFK